MSPQAVSAGHKLGQMIGNFFEDFFSDTFNAFARQRKLYCDKRGPRPAVRGNKLKVTWRDKRRKSARTWITYWRSAAAKRNRGSQSRLLSLPGADIPNIRAIRAGKLKLRFYI